MDENLFAYQIKIHKQARREKQQQHSFVIWLTGLSGSGKSTIANKLDEYLFKQGFNSYILDGDNIRSGLNKDLDFSDQGRHENIRRISETAKLFVDAGIIVITAFISPFRQERDLCRNLLEPNEFVEVYIDTPLSICELRDVKGLYKKARKKEIQNFTGIDSPYEPPKNPEITVPTENISIENSTKRIIDYIHEKKYISTSSN